MARIFTHLALALLDARFLNGEEAIEYSLGGPDAYDRLQVALVRPRGEDPFYLDRHRLFGAADLRAPETPWPPWIITRGSATSRFGHCAQWFGRPKVIGAPCELVPLAADDRIPLVTYEWIDKFRRLGRYVPVVT